MTQGPWPEISDAPLPALRRVVSAVQRNLIPGLILAAGIGVAASAYITRQNQFDLQATQRFEIPARNQGHAIATAIARSADEMQAVAALFHGTAFVSRTEFADFAARLQRRNPGVSALSWLPRVLNDEREEFEARAQAEGFDGFHITDMTRQGRVPAATRDVYYPTFYVAPSTAGTQLGFDAFGDAARARTIITAALSGAPAVTSRLQLASGTGFGVLVYAPILTGDGDLRLGGEDPTDIVPNLSSVVVGLLDLPAIMKATVADTRVPLGLDVYLYDLAAEGDARLLAFLPSPARSGAFAPLGEADARSGTHIALDFRIGDRNWQLVMRPIAPVTTTFEAVSPWLAAGVVLMLAGVLARMVAAGRERTREVERRVDSRTRELRESEERLRLVADALPAMITYVDAGHRIQFANRTTAEWLARAPGNIVGAFMEPVMGVEFVRGTHDAVIGSLAGQATSFAGHFKFGDGHTRYVEGVNVPRVTPAGHVSGYYSLMLDATERRQLLIEAENFFTMSLTALAVIDYEGQFRRVNRAWSDMFGYSEAEMRGLPRLAMTHPDDRARAAAMLSHMMVFGEAKRDQEIRFLRKDGSVRTGLFMAAPVPEEQIIYFAAVDVTDRKRDEEELRAARNQALAATRAKSEFLANMSHEIRTPLNAVLGFSDLALTTRLSPQQRAYVQKVRTSGQLLLDLINDILDFSKIEAGKLELEVAPFVLGDVVAAVGGVVGIKAAEKKLDLFFAIAPDVPDQLNGDAVRITQVLVNLIGNAVKFTTAGEIFVRIEWADPGRRLLRLAVTDTGMGMSEAVQNKLFQPFQQADNSITRKFGGTGLGLAISRQIAELMGGEIGVTSTEGVGSTFWVTAEFPDAAEATPRTKVARVLLVDSRVREAARIEAALAESGTHCTTVASAEAAVRACAEAQTPFDAVAFDLTLGMGAIARIRVAAAAIADGVPPRWVGLAGETSMPEGNVVAVMRPLDSVRLRTALAGEQAPETAGAGGPAEAVAIPGLRVLLAEDNPVNQEVATEMLVAAGAVVTIANDGTEAVRKVAEAPHGFDVVLMDLQMPNMDGVTACITIRHVKKRDELPILAMTAHSLGDERDRCFAAGMNDYLTKPITAARLTHALARYLPAAAPVPAPASGPAPMPVAPGPADVELPAQLPGIAVADAKATFGFSDKRFAQLLGMFHKQYRSLVHDLRNAADPKEIARLAHTVRGSAAYLRAADLVEAATAVEDAIRRGEAPGALLPRLEQAAQIVVAATEPFAEPTAPQ